MKIITLIILLIITSTGIFALNYTVRNGDTLYKIANNNNTTVQRIIEDNNIKNPNLIITGSNLKINTNHIVKSKNIQISCLSNPEMYIRCKFGVNANIALAIAKCESGLRANAIGDRYPIAGLYAESIGIFQIRLLKGRPSREWLLNYTNNIDYAYNMSNAGKNWNAWSCFSTKKYIKYL